MKGEQPVSCACVERPNWFFFVLVLVVMFGGFYFLSTIKTISPTNIYVSTNGSAVATEHNTISVSGSANEKVEPNMLVVNYYVQTKSESAKEAQSKNAEISNAIVSSLKALGIGEKDIKTTSYNVNVNQESHYICDNQSGKSDCYWTYVNVGYTATHTFTVNVYDLNKGGAVVDAIGAAGGEVSGVSFDLKPETKKEVYARLLSLAAANAKKKADAIASGAGVSVDKPLSLSESYYYTPIYYPKVAYADALLEAAPTQLSSGTIDISVSVSAVFEIK
ncbi:MAG: SIMPL domain-containing protein [Candidatus Bilamarchaeaceae archaeon]